MYVYVIKCVNYFKIGHSKNPTARRAAIQTHNPLDVKICALLKSSNASEIEKQLHMHFLHRKSRGEWFELKHDDLKSLKVDLGFTFKIPLSKLFDDGSFDNTKNNLATKEVRSINLLYDDLKEYFEELYGVEVVNGENIRKSIMKYNHQIVKDTINVMYEKDYMPDYVLKNLLKLSRTTDLKYNNPEQYFVHRLKGMFWGQYKYNIDEEDAHEFKDAYKRATEEGLDLEEVLSVFQRYSYSLNWQEMLKHISNFSISF